MTRGSRSVGDTDSNPYDADEGPDSHEFAPTDYLESNALLAIIADDEQAVYDVLERMDYAELVALERHAMRLARLCAAEQRSRQDADLQRRLKEERTE